MKNTPALLAAVLTVGAAHAVVTVTDNGLTAPTLTANDTGFTGTTNQRFGWDIEMPTQSFTVASNATINSIFLGYNAFENGDTLTLNLYVNGNLVEGGIVLDGNNFSGTTADNNAGPFYWMEFDLSTLSVPVTAGVNDFTMEPTANTGNSWALAPRYNSNSSSYPGGEMTGLATTGDLAFAVTTTPVPEPSVALLGGLGILGLLRRRRS